MTPFLWDETLRTLTLRDKRVAWLLAVPISDAELRYDERKGPDALESLFENQHIDVFDISRPSVV